MVKLVALYGHPTDTQQFETFYANEHGPLVAQLPGPRSVSVGKVAPNPDGSPAAYNRMYVLTFDSPEALRAAIATPNGQHILADLPKFCTGGVTILTVLEDDAI